MRFARRVFRSLCCSGEVGRSGGLIHLSQSLCLRRGLAENALHAGRRDAIAFGGLTDALSLMAVAPDGLMVQRESFEPQAGESRNKMPSWLPRDDYLTSFKLGYL